MLLLLAACGREELLPGRGGSQRATGGTSHEREAGRDTDAGAGRKACSFKGFAAPVAYAPSTSPRALIAADVTTDGHLDLLIKGVVNGAPVFELLTNDGRGTFSRSSLPVALDPNASTPVVADFNGDGFVDLASVSNKAPSWPDLATDDGVLAFDFGTGAGALASRAVTVAAPQTNGSLMVADFDGDGRPDLALAGYDYVMMAGGVNGDGRILFLRRVRRISRSTFTAMWAPGDSQRR